MYILQEMFDSISDVEREHVFPTERGNRKGQRPLTHYYVWKPRTVKPLTGHEATEEKWLRNGLSLMRTQFQYYSGVSIWKESHSKLRQ